MIACGIGGLDPDDFERCYCCDELFPVDELEDDLCESCLMRVEE